MGMHVKAYLIYGFKIYDPEDDDLEQLQFAFDLTEDLWDDAYARSTGLIDESQYFTEQGEYTYKKGSKEFKVASKLYDQYWNKKYKLTKNLGIEIAIYGHCDYPIYYIQCKEISSDTSSEVKVKDLRVSNKRIQKMKQICEVLNIKWQTPQWHLVAHFG